MDNKIKVSLSSIEKRDKVLLEKLLHKYRPDLYNFKEEAWQKEVTTEKKDMILKEK